MFAVCHQGALYDTYIIISFDYHNLINAIRC